MAAIAQKLWDLSGFGEKIAPATMFVLEEMAKGATKAAKKHQPTLQLAQQQAQQHIRSSLVGCPPKFIALNAAILTFLRQEPPSKELLSPLLQQANFLRGEAAHLRESFRHLNDENLALITQFLADLDALNAPAGEIVLSDEVRERFNQINTLLCSYGMNSEEGTHRVMLREFNQELNRTANTNVKNLKEALDAIAALPPESNVDLRKKTIAQALVALEALNIDRDCPELSQPDRGNFATLCSHQSPLYSEDVSDLAAIQISIRAVHAIITKFFTESLGIIPRTIQVATQSLRQAFSARVHLPLRALKSSFDAVHALASDAPAESVKAALRKLIQNLHAFTQAPEALGQIPEREKGNFPVLLEALKVMEGAVPNSQVLKHRIAELRQVVSRAVQTNQGLIEQTLEAFAEHTEELIGPMSDRFFASLRQKLNASAHPALRKVVQSLEAVHSLTTGSSQQTQREAVDQLLNDLQALIQRRAEVQDIEAEHWSLFIALNTTIGAYPAPLPALAVIKQDIQTCTPALRAAFVKQRGMLEESMDTILGRGEQVLDELAGYAETAVTRHVAKSLASFLEFIFTCIRDGLQGRQRDEIVANFQPSITHLKQAKDSGSWAEIVSALRSCFKVLRENEIYFQGMRLPFKPVRRYASAVPDLLKLVKSHENVLSSNVERTRVSPAMVDHMAMRLTHRSSSFIAQRILSDLFRFPLNDATSAALLQVDPAESPDSLSKVLRARFNLHIDNSSLNIVTRWIVKLAYPLVTSITTLYIQSICKGILKDFSGWQKLDTNAKSKQVIDWLKNWLSIVSGMYTEVAGTPPNKVKDIFILLDEAAKNPSRNHKLTPPKFYHALVQTMLKAFGPRISWTESLAAYFDKLRIPPTSKFAPFNVILGPVNFFCKKALQAVVYIPQRVINFFLKKGTSMLLLKSVNLQKLVNDRINNLRDPKTPTSFAMHQLIYNLMLDIERLVRERLTDPNPDPTKALSQDKQSDISDCVYALLEVLENSRFHTVARLKTHCDNHLTLREKFEREVDELFLPLVEPAIALTISTALEGALGEQDLRDMVYKFLEVADNIYDPQKPISDAQFHAVDKGMGDLTDAILGSMIHNALSGILDFDNGKQIDAICKFTDQLKTDTAKFTAEIEEQRTIVLTPTTSSDGVANAVRKMVLLSQQFLNLRIEALGRADGNRFFHTQTKTELNELARKLQEQVAPLTTKLNELEKLQQEINDFNRTGATFQNAYNIATRVGSHLTKPALSPLDFENAAREMQALAAFMQAQGTSTPQNMRSAYEGLILAKDQLEKPYKTHIHLQAMKPKWEELIALKRSGTASRQRIQQAEQALRQICEELSLPQEDLKTTFEATLSLPNGDAFETSVATFEEQFEKTSREVAAALQESGQNLNRAKNELQFFFMAMQGSATQKSEANRAQIMQKTTNLLTELQAIRTWQTQVQYMKMFSGFLLDMQWMQDTAQSFAMWRATDLVKRARAALVKRHIYRSLLGLAGTNFLEAYG